MLLSAPVTSPLLETSVPPVWGVVAHVVHYTLVLGGLVGVIALLLPQYAERVPVLRRLLPPASGRLSEHDRRVAELRSSLSRPALVGAGGSPLPPATAADRSGRGRRSSSPVSSLPPGLPPGVRLSTLVLPIAVVASAAAAAVHAAVGPEHFEEGLLLGLFFACSSTAQLGWSILVLRQAARRACPAWLLWSGAAGNLVCLVLWAITRTLGLPFNLIQGREAVGPWDVAAGVWEAMVVIACLVALRRGYRAVPAAKDAVDAVDAERRGLAVGAWPQWQVAARLLVLVSFAVLVALSFSGAGA